MTAGKAPAALSPAMLAALVAVRDGVEVDGRSWRALAGLERRGLITEVRHGGYALTEAGRDRLAAGMVIGGVQR